MSFGEIAVNETEIINFIRKTLNTWGEALGGSPLESSEEGTKVYVSFVFAV